MADLVFHPDADRELDAAGDYYLRRSPAAAKRFTGAMKSLLEEVAARPERFPWFDSPYREASLVRFPYSVLYRVDESGCVFVIAVAHASRDPDYWRERE
jgi:plasmid stabilization system protein ParE